MVAAGYSGHEPGCCHVCMVAIV